MVDAFDVFVSCLRNPALTHLGHEDILLQLSSKRLYSFVFHLYAVGFHEWFEVRLQ